MTAIILAAGKGSRLGAGIPKVLVQVGNKTLLEKHLTGLQEANISDIYIVSGFKHELIKEKVKELSAKYSDLKIKVIENTQYNAKENGYSAYVGLQQASGSCLVIMGDHYFDYAAIISREDRNQNNSFAYIDMDTGIIRDDATKFLVDDTAVTNSSKSLQIHNAYDTGLFFIHEKDKPAIYKTIESHQTNWNDCVLTLISKGLKYKDIRGSQWNGINTPEDLQNLESQLRNAQTLLSGQ